MYNNNYVYRLRLQHLLNTRTCYPAGLPDLNKEVRRDDNQAFTRKFMNGDFIFTKDDFLWLKAIEDGPDSCLYISAILDRSCDNQQTWSVYFEGQFTTKAGKWDLDRCRYSTPIEPNDIYTCIERGSSRESNIISIGTEYTINDPGYIYSYEWFVQTAAQATTTCAAMPGLGPSGAGWDYVGCDSTASPILIYGFWWREYQWTLCIAGVPHAPDGLGWTLDTNNCATTGMAKFVRTPTETPPVISTDFYFTGCTNGIPDKPIGTSCIVELVGSDCSDNWAWWWDRCPPAGTDYTHFRSLYDAAKYVCQAACIDVNDVESDFFEWNPIGDAPGYTPGVNYVTGESPNKPHYTYIAAKSDVLLPTATQPATIAKMTFSQLTAWLYNIFQVKWWYNEATGNIRFEHVSFLQFATGIDLTVSPYARMMIGKNVYTYLRDKRYKTEKFKMMESKGVDFVGLDIIYDFNCIDPVVGGPRGGNNALQIAGMTDNSITYSAEKITTDLEYIVSSPSEISTDGFVLMCAVDDGFGNLSVDYEPGAISGNTKANGHLAYANLHNKYWRHDRVLINGNMNGNDETFESAKRTKRQSDIVIFECCDTEINTEEMVKTGLGFGEIDNYTVSLMTNKLTMNINL